jgi:hypothetical protein
VHSPLVRGQSYRLLPQNRRSLVAQQARERYAVRLVGIMNRARSQARARPFHSLRVGSDASDEEIDQLAGGGDVWDDVVDAPASVQAEDSPKKGQLPVKAARDDEVDPDEAMHTRMHHPFPSLRLIIRCLRWPTLLLDRTLLGSQSQSVPHQRNGKARPRP